jgi:hypothetical protein
MQGFGEFRILLGQLLNRFSICTIHGQTAEFFRMLMVAVNVHGSRDTGFLLKSTKGGGMVDAVLCHMPIGCPLASNDREKTRVVNVNCVVARKRRGFSIAGAGCLDQRPDSYIYAENIFAGGLVAKIATGSLEDKFDLFFEGERFIGDRFDRRVGSAD